MTPRRRNTTNRAPGSISTQSPALRITPSAHLPYVYVFKTMSEAATMEFAHSKFIQLVVLTHCPKRRNGLEQVPDFG